MTPFLSSHTSTEQWQSFEMRMRRRRAERCVLRAEVALEAGFEEDAHVALAEARKLDANAPDFDAVLATVVARMRETVELERAARRRRRRTYAAAAVLVAASVVGSAALMIDTSGPAVVMSAEAVAAPRAPEPATIEPAASVVVKSEAPMPKPTPASRPEPNSSPAPASSNRDRTEPVPARAVETRPEVPSRDLPAVSSAPAPLPALPPATTVPAPDLPVATPTIPKAEPRDETPAVRAALDRYEAAFSALNVAATRAVWPAVDARSLSRAFDGLASQQVSLGACTVAIEGASARADCSGSASYTPKVGGGTRTESRQWKFELKQVGGAWQIVRAEAR